MGLWWAVIIIAAYLLITLSLNHAKANAKNAPAARDTARSSSSPPSTATAPARHSSMQAVDAGCGKNVSYTTSGSYMSRQIEWRSAVGSDGEASEIRIPEPKRTGYPAIGGFHAAGRRYAGMHQLKHQPIDDSGRWLDTHGREVICVSERFPCFDSYDYLHENRYYNWFILCENDRFTVIYHADETLTLYVTEDVREMETNCADSLKALGYLA